MKNKLRYIIIGNKLVQWLLLKVIPKIRLSTGYGRTSWDDYSAILERALPGDIIFSADRAKISTLLIPGDWSHVGIVAEKHECKCKIVEAVPEGVRITDLYSFCQTSDEVMLMRPYPLSRSLVENQEMFDRIMRDRALFAKSLVGRSYDALFSRNNQALYCAELVHEVWGGFCRFDWSDFLGLGHPYLTPDGIAESPDLVQVYVRRLEKT